MATFAPPSAGLSGPVGSVIGSSGVALPTPLPVPAGGPAADVEMADVSTQLATGAAATTIQWTTQDTLLLVSAVLRATSGRPTSPDVAPLQTLLDWTAVATLVQQKSTSVAAGGAFPADACALRFSHLVRPPPATAVGVSPAGVAPAPISSLEVTTALSALMQRLARERMTELEADGALVTAKQLRLESACTEATSRLQAQKDTQAAAAVAAGAAAAASAAAAAAAAPPAAAAPTPVAFNANGPVLVKLESISGARPAAAGLLSPINSAAGASAASATAASSDVAPRPSPLLISSPFMSSLSGAIPGTSPWLNSSLHTPLKSMSQVSLSRQSSAAAAGLSSPTLGRQQSNFDLNAPPSTPSASGAAAPVPLSAARIAEIFQLILDTLTARPEASDFLEPVNPNDAQGYYEVIKTPMAFSDVREKVAAGEITAPGAFWSALNQIYQNCYTYNDKKTTFYRAAKTLDGITLDMFRKHFAGFGYAGPWEPTNKKGGQGRPPKYTPVTPSLTASASYAAPSPMASPTAASNNLAAIPLHLPLTSQTAASAASAAAAGATNGAAVNAAPSAPNTPTKKGPSGSGSGRTQPGSGADAPMDAASDELPKGGPPRRGSVHSTSGSQKKGATGRDAEGDETMQGEDDATSTADGKNADEAGSEAGEGDVGSIHDQLTTPARGGPASSRKRGAAGLAPPTPSPAVTAAPSTATTPAARKNARKNAPATPSASAMPTPTAVPAPVEDAMDTSDTGNDKSKRRGRPPKK